MRVEKVCHRRNDKAMKIGFSSLPSVCENTHSYNIFLVQVCLIASRNLQYVDLAFPWHPLVAYFYRPIFRPPDVFSPLLSDFPNKFESMRRVAKSGRISKGSKKSCSNIWGEKNLCFSVSHLPSYPATPPVEHAFKSIIGFWPFLLIKKRGKCVSMSVRTRKQGPCGAFHSRENEYGRRKCFAGCYVNGLVPKNSPIFSYRMALRMVNFTYAHCVANGMWVIHKNVLYDFCAVFYRVAWSRPWKMGEPNFR